MIEDVISLGDLQRAVYFFIKDNGGIYPGEKIHEKMKNRIDWAVIDLVNRGLVNVKLDWTLEIKK